MQVGFALFLAMSTQWRIASTMSSTFATGLDYGVIEITARNAELELTPAVFSDVRALESEALRVWASRR
jgi:hypothetical protein